MGAYFNNSPVTLSLTSYTGVNENVTALSNNFPPLMLVGRMDDGGGLIYDQYESYIYDNLGTLTQIFNVQDYNDESYRVTIKFNSDEDNNVYVSDFLSIDAFTNGSIPLCNDVLDCFVVNLTIPVDISNSTVSSSNNITANQTVTIIKPLVVRFARPPRVSPFNFEFRLAPTPTTSVADTTPVVTTSPSISVVVSNFEECPTGKCNILGF